MKKLFLALILFITQIIVGYLIYQLGYILFGSGSKTGLFWGLSIWFAYKVFLWMAAINAVSIVVLNKDYLKIVIATALFALFTISFMEVTYHPYKSLLNIICVFVGLSSAVIVDRWMLRRAMRKNIKTMEQSTKQGDSETSSE